ncbi:MAG: VTT domain-containing protein [Steroidobacteraceae bacterium]|nr:VTT domain-containing protein [Steroidobacteraceae bacterium]
MPAALTGAPIARTVRRVPTPDPLAPPPVERSRAPGGRAIGILVLGVAALLLGLSAGLHARVVAGIELLRGVVDAHPHAAPALFVALAAASAMLVLFSGALLVPLGIESWGASACFLLLWSGWWLGGALAYGLGRAFGRPLVERLLPRDALARHEGRIGAQLTFPAAVLVLLGLPSDVVGYFFGVVRYPPSHYLAALLLAELPYAWGTVFLGGAFLERQMLPLLLAVAATLAVLGWQRWWRSA